jgi:hypothetical protein
MIWFSAIALIGALGGGSVSAQLAGPANIYPDKAVTPGVVDPEATVDKVCTPKYTTKVRHVTVDEKKALFARYHLKYIPHLYEVDHFIPLELGGSNDIKNLWPEPFEPQPGAHEKDKVENALHKDVCKGKLTLEQAQQIISTDWYAYYLQLPKHSRHRKKRHY